MTTITLAVLAKHWRAAMFAALLATVAALGLFARHEHAQVATARAQAATASAEAVTIRADAARNEAALQAEAADVAARAAADNLLRSSIHAASPTSDCARSPAVRALLGGLRQPSGARASSSARRPADVRG